MSTNSCIGVCFERRRRRADLQIAISSKEQYRHGLLENKREMRKRVWKTGELVVGKGKRGRRRNHRKHHMGSVGWELRLVQVGPGWSLAGLDGIIYSLNFYSRYI